MTMEFPGALGGLVAGLLLVAVTLAIALWIGRRNVGQIRRQADELRRTVGRQAEQIQELTEDRSRLAADQAALSTTTATLQAELAAGREALKKAQAARDDALALSNQLGDQLASARTDVERLELEAIDVAPVRAELERVGRLRAVLTQRLEVLTRLKQEADADRIRLTLQVEALDLQVRGAVRTGTEDQQRQEATRMLLSAQVLDLRRRLEDVQQTSTALEAAQAQSAERETSALQKVSAADARLREARLAHQEAAAALEAAKGAATAQLERLEPLRRQLADREELIRSLARERDEALQFAGRLEAKLTARQAEHDALTAETARLREHLRLAGTRVGEADLAVAAMARHRDELAAATRRDEARLESMAVEVRERDVRFRTLLEDRAAAVAALQDEIHHLREDSKRGLQSPPVEEDNRNGQVGGSSNNGGQAPAAGPPIPPTDQMGPAALPTDDLQQIAGIGPAIERLLNERGIRTFRQLAEWSVDDAVRFGEELGPLRGRIERDRWIEQARGLYIPSPPSECA